MVYPRFRSHVIVGAIAFNYYHLNPVSAQTFACATVEDCTQTSTLSCKDWIESLSNFQGSCCSFQDVRDGSEVKCKLIIAGVDGGSCGWVDPAKACAPDATTCVYAGEVYSVFETGTECPASKYDPFAAATEEDNGTSEDQSSDEGFSSEEGISSDEGISTGADKSPDEEESHDDSEQSNANVGKLRKHRGNANRRKRNKNRGRGRNNRNKNIN